MTAMPWEVFAPEQLTVTSGLNPAVEIDLLAPAWMVLDLARLSIPNILIDNREAPGGTGSNPLPGAELELRAALPFWITGSVDRNGIEPSISTEAQFRRHWVYLSQHLFVPSGDDALDAVYQSPDPDEDPIEFRIQFAAPDIPARWPSDWQGLLNVVLPDGALIPAGVV